MSFLQWIIWILIGAITAYAFLKMQSSSVRWITPEKPKMSVGLVVGGAFLRWILVFFLLALALRQSIMAALVLFATFMTVRLILLFLFNAKFMPEIARSQGVKD